MPKTFVKNGHTLTYTAPTGGVSAGDVVERLSGASGRIGLVQTDAAAGANTTLALSGVHEVAKESGTGDDWADGENVYYDSGNDEFTTVASGNTLAGTAFGDWGASATTGQLLLNDTPAA